MIMKMLTHVHLLVYTWWCWRNLRRRLRLKGREGFGFLSPKLGEIRRFQENERNVFYCTGGKFGEVARASDVNHEGTRR